MYIQKLVEIRVLEIYLRPAVYFKNVRDQSTISFLARQLSPLNTKAVLEAYKKSTSEPYSYLLIDLNPQSSDLVRFRSSVFATDARVFVSKAFTKELGKDPAIPN